MNGAYTAPIYQVFTAFGQTIAVTNLVHFDFSSCDPLPPSTPGAETIHTYSSQVTVDVSVNGAPPTSYQAPAVTTIRWVFNHQNGSVRLFDTEMLQLDITGGNLPAGIMVRESPTLSSTGLTTVTPLLGEVQIDSYFDEFMELSLNSGLIWTPAPQSGRVTLTRPGCNVPALTTTWGKLKVLYR